MKRFLKYLLYFVIGIIACIGLYFLCALLFGKVRISEKSHENKNITCYIKSNGVHTDIVVPIQNEIVDWNKYFNPENTKKMNPNWRWLAIGWGDKGFYLETPTWADLKAKTAFKAAFGLSSSALHLTYYTKIIETENCYSFQISEEQYKNLEQFILNSTELESEKGIFIKTDAVYGTNDAFYEAKGKYSLFKTCNSWSNEALKSCGAKAAFWTPFDSGILQHYQSN